MKPARKVRAGVLEVAYEETGVPNGTPVVLLHGFPYDVRAYDEVAVRVAAMGARVLVPYLRAFGGTQFVSEATMRSGQQGALAADLLAFLDALAIDRAVLAGYDWGGRAACIVAALEPERVAGLVTGGGYNVHDIPASAIPAAPEVEHVAWYQYYFHGERGRRALEERRGELARYLWQTWSPAWRFDDETFARTATSFDTPDFAAVVAHSYRHRFGLVGGDRAYDDIERALERQPAIAVSTISLEGIASPFRVNAAKNNERAHFTGPFELRELAGVGHNIPQEAPGEFAAAVGMLLP